MKHITFFTSDQKEELKQIADKIHELKAKKMNCQMNGDLDGAWSAHKGLKFAKQYFAKRERAIKASARRKMKEVNVQ